MDRNIQVSGIRNSKCEEVLPSSREPHLSSVLLNLRGKTSLRVAVVLSFGLTLIKFVRYDELVL
jgi:hypothetical protein